MNKILLLKELLYKRWFLRLRSREQVERYQRKRWKKQLQYMESHSPYFAKHGIQALPKMNKAFMMEHFDELNTVGVKRDEAMEVALNAEKSRDFSPTLNGVSVGLSSGTSGHRGLFLSTEREQALWAANVCAKLLPRGKLFGNRIAFFLRADNNLYHSVNSPLLRYEYFDTFADISEHIERLNAYQPTILVAPPSMLLRLGKEVRRGNLKIKPLKIISVAEILEDTDKRYLQKAFRTKVIHQVYQATEGFLACTCEYGNLHINEDGILLEKRYLDENRFYPIITDLQRTSQPMIRYELNDILVESRQACPCGSPFLRIERIEGRSDDIFVFSSREEGKVVEVFPDFIRRCILFVEGILEYQVIQNTDGSLEIACNQLSEEKKQAIVYEFEKLAEQKKFLLPEITFTQYHWDRRVKLKRVVRKSIKNMDSVDKVLRKEKYESNCN
ncbi:MAG: CoF synthetase [Eubacteriales bacterium]|nr:CoF synthetase [Eubacteriales bacterium]